MLQRLRGLDYGYKTQTLATPRGFEFVIHEKSPQKNSTKLFAGRFRVETITDVKFVNDTTLVAGNRDQKLLYLLRVDLQKKTCSIIDRVVLKFDGKNPMPVTLICVDGNRLYTTFINNKIGVVDIVGDKLVLRGMYSLGNVLHSFHGMTIHNDKVYYSSSQEQPGLVILDKPTNVATHVLLPGMEEIHLKQTRVLGEYLVANGTTGSISDQDLYSTYDGYVGVFKRDTLECVDLLHLPGSQMDDICIYENHIYFIRQGSEPYGQVFKYSIQDGKLVKEHEYRVGQFPHGLDIRNGWMACSSMKNESIQFFRI